MRNPNSNPNRKTDDGPDVIDPENPIIEPGADVDDDRESRTSEAIHEPRPETSPPVKPVNMPM